MPKPTFEPCRDCVRPVCPKGQCAVIEGYTSLIQEFRVQCGVPASYLKPCEHPQTQAEWAMLATLGVS